MTMLDKEETKGRPDPDEVAHRDSECARKHERDRQLGLLKQCDCDCQFCHDDDEEEEEEETDMVQGFARVAFDPVHLHEEETE